MWCNPSDSIKKGDIKKNNQTCEFTLNHSKGEKRCDLGRNKFLCRDHTRHSLIHFLNIIFLKCEGYQHFEDYSELWTNL